MKNKLKTAGIITVVIFCMLLGCEKKEERGEELIFLSADEEPEQGTEDEGGNVEIESREEAPVQYCVVHVCGAVKDPGVYQLEAESRIYQAVAMAGGFCEDADGDYLNQADRVLDGMKIYVPTVEETENAGNLNDWAKSGGMEQESLLVNVNTADETLLCTLPGIGSSKAKSIIAYREKNGVFQKIEDIMNVEGIKEGLFQKIKDSITV